MSITSSLPNLTSAAPHGTPERLLRGAGLVYVTTIVQLVGRLAVTFLIGRVLGAEGLGVFTLAFVTAQTLTMLAVNGQDMGILKFVTPAFKQGDRATMRRMFDAGLVSSLAAAAVLMFAMMFGLPFFVYNATQSETARAIAPWFAPALVMQTASLLLNSYALACGRVYVKAFSDRVFGTVTLLVVTGVGMWLNLGLWSLVSGLLAASVVTLGATVLMMFDLYPGGVAVTRRVAAMRQLLSYSWKIGLANAANYALLNAALLVLGSIDAVQAGIYAAASRLTFLGLLFMDAFGTNFAPHAAGKMNEPSLQQDYQRVTLWMIVLSAPIYLVLFAFAPQWMNFLGADFVGGAPVLMVLSAAQLLNMLTGNGGILITLSHRPELRVLNTVVIWGTNLILILLLAPRLGALGAAMAYLVAMLLTVVLEYVETRFVLNISPWHVRMLKPLGLIVMCGAALLAVENWMQPSFAVALALAAMFLGGYTILMLRLGLPRMDVELLKRAMPRWVVSRVR